MSARKSSGKARTWIEIDESAVRHNYRTFRSLIKPSVKLWVVVKSNAYGHGIFLFSKLLARLGVDGFCVDSLIEGVKLREEGIQSPILVLGPTLHALYPEAAKNNITVTISNLDALRALAKTRTKPEFHLKFDTGMHRQGFFPEEVLRVLAFIKQASLGRKFKGIYTHFASATSIPSKFTETQFTRFLAIKNQFEQSGFKHLVAHAAATGGTLIDPRYHLDAVRVGKGMYGFFPAREMQKLLPKVSLRPVLSWRTFVSEVKKLKKGDRIGYDLTEAVRRPTTIAIIPVGYWHGLARALSSKGEVLVCGKRAKILGRVSMDLTVVDVTGIGAHVGDTVTLLGRDGRDYVSAWEVAEKAGTIPYEFLTRLNPLIEKVTVSGR